MGHDIILLYLGWEGSRSKGVDWDQKCMKFRTQTELAPLARIEGRQNQRFLRLPRVARPCRGQLGVCGPSKETEESLIRPPPPSRTPRGLIMALFPYKAKISQFLAKKFKVKVDALPYSLS